MKIKIKVNLLKLKLIYFFKQEHLKKKGVGVRKVVFLVNQVALAKQQFDSCREYMESDWPIQLISGDTQDTNKVPVKDLLDRYNLSNSASENLQVTITQNLFRF